MFKTGRVLWESDVGDEDVSKHFSEFFGELFYREKAIDIEDVGDATSYLMPGGFVVVTDTYATNHGIYAPPRKAAEGSQWGLRIEPREDPVVMPVVLPDDYDRTDEARNVYQRQPAKGEEHTARTRKFSHTTWIGTVYVLCNSERDAEWHRSTYLRSPQERVLDAVKNWYDNENNIYQLRTEIDGWYLPEGRRCRDCGALNRTHPSKISDTVQVGDKTVLVHDLEVFLCGACRAWSVNASKIGESERLAASRVLRYYGPNGERLRFARHALGIGLSSFTDSKKSQVVRWEKGSPEDPEGLRAYTDDIIERLETTW